jgi:hypothetical protein
LRVDEVEEQLCTPPVEGKVGDQGRMAHAHKYVARLRVDCLHRKETIESIDLQPVRMVQMAQIVSSSGLYSHLITICAYQP